MIESTTFDVDSNHHDLIQILHCHHNFHHHSNHHHIEVYSHNVHFQAHSLVLFVRCSRILDELTKAKIGEIPWDVLNWSGISKNVAIGFLRYLYSGIWDVELNSFEDWEQAKSIGRKYDLDWWSSYVESFKDGIDQPLD